VGAQELVQQVAVAMLEVHEVGPAVAGHARGPDVAADELLDIGVGQHLFVGGDVELPVQDRVAVGHAGFPALLVMGTAEAAGVGQLETDDQVVDRTPAGEVLRLEDLHQLRDARLVLGVDDQLVHVRPAVGPDGHGLGAADEFGTARAEALPAPLHLLGGAAGGRAVPALHRMNRDAVADGLAVDLGAGDRLGERVAGAGLDGVLDRQVDAERGAVGPEIGDGLERRDAGKLESGGHGDVPRGMSRRSEMRRVRIIASVMRAASSGPRISLQAGWASGEAMTPSWWSRWAVLCL